MAHKPKQHTPYALLCSTPLWFLVVCLLFGLLLLFPWAYAHSEAWTAEEEALWQAYQQDELIRLHILADSDDPDAQALKLQVRDAILLSFGQLLQAQMADDFASATNALKNDLESITNIAKETVLAQGYDLTVTAEVGRFVLPEKQYGNVILPEDEYFALQIVLGEGEGENWWCVLFPQMCLMSASEEPWQSETSTSAFNAHDFTWESQQILNNWLAFMP